MPEDTELVQNYLNGDAEAFSQLLSQHIDRVYLFSLRIVLDPHIADDVTQQTFVNAWKRLSSYDTNRRFITWLLAIAHNTAVDHMRKNRSLPFSFFQTDEDGNALTDTLSDPEPLPDALFEKAEEMQALTVALKSCTTEERTILHLHFTEGLTFEEMSTVLGKPKDTLKSKHRRALIKLRNLLTN